MFALNPHTGVPLWPAFFSGDCTYCTPAVGPTGTIYMGNDDSSVGYSMFAINPQDGSQKWVYSANQPVLYSPSVGSDGVIYFGSDDDSFYALNPDDGTVKWSTYLGKSSEAIPAIGPDGTIYIGGEDTMFALNSTDGAIVWSYAGHENIYSGAVVSSDGNVYFGSITSWYYCVNAGTLVWEYNAGSEAGSYVNTPALVPSGTLYVATNDGNLLAFDP